MAEIEVEEEAVEVRTVSMRPRQWVIVDREAASRGGSRSWALRTIVEEWQRMKRQYEDQGQG